MRSPGCPMERLGAIGVQQQDLELPAVALVDQTRCVDERDAVLGRQARAREHEPGVARRQFDRDPGRDPRPFARLEHEVVQRAQIEAGIAGVGAHGDDRARVELLYAEPHATA